MLNFVCTNCNNEIQAEYQYIGEMVQCPICDSLQVVPDPLLPNGSTFHGYQVRKALATTMLWNTYEAVGLTIHPDKQVLLRVPTTFFMKNVSNFDAFVEMLVRTGSLKRPVFPELLDRSIAPGRVYFAYEFIPVAYRLSHFTGENALDYNNVLMVARDIAEALKDTWEKDGLIHQNLNTLNVRITNKLKPWIMNMGQSQFLLQDQQLLKYGFNIWDYHYMSPEFIGQGIADSPSCDIYALGGIIFLLCTGKEPHEDVDPENIAGAPVPSIAEFVPDIPDKLNSLIQLMMNPNPKLRLGTWDEVIERIDKLITDTARMRKSLDIVREFNISGFQTNRFEPVGLQPGHNRKKVINVSTGKIQTDRGVSMSDTMARLASKQEINALNRQWRQQQQQTRRNLRPKSSAISPTAIVFAAVFVFVSIISFSVVYYANRTRKEIPTQVKQGDQDTAAPGTQQSPATVEKVPGRPTRRDTSPRQGEPAKSPNEAEFEDITKFLEENPAMRREALERYSRLVSKAVKSQEFNLADRIQGQINILQADAASAESEKVKPLLDAIKDRIRPLLQEGKYDEAIEIVTNYDGELSAESKAERLRLASAIKERIANIEKNREENAKAIEAFTLKFAETLLLENKIVETKIKIDLALQLEKNEFVKNQAEIWLDDLESLDKLESEIASSRTAEDLINSPEYSNLFAGSALLRGLVYLRKSQFDKARESFNKLTEGAPKVFITFMKEKEAQTRFRQLLEKNGFRYDNDDPEGLMMQLSEKIIRKTDAGVLSTELTKFNEAFAESKFVNENANLFDALNTYCARITGVSVPTRTAPVTIAPEESAENNGKRLLNILENSKSGDTVTLAEGVYKLVDLRLGQADIKIKGVGKVEFDTKNIIVTGRAITLENIILTNGTVRLESATTISFINCRLKGKETQVLESHSVKFDNCLIKGIYIKKTNNISFNHCTIVTPVGGIEAALRLEGEDLEITNSILYGEKYAVMILTEEDSTRQRMISNTLWFGESALLVKRVGNQPLKEKDIINSPTRLKRFTRTRANIHKPPLFIDATNGDYRLAKDVPGTGAASDKKDCGVRWPTAP
ncbi:MAG: protein kinase [Victivallales bacterium]|nr:protein kinase [Victivallales bacterium]